MLYIWKQNYDNCYILAIIFILLYFFHTYYINDYFFWSWYSE